MPQPTKIAPAPPPGVREVCAELEPPDAASSTVLSLPAGPRASLAHLAAQQPYNSPPHHESKRTLAGSGGEGPAGGFHRFHRRRGETIQPPSHDFSKKKLNY